MSTPLSANLARYRKARDLSQEQLAEAATLGVDTVARIEQGRRTSSRPGTVRKLASALGVTVDALIGHTTPVGKNDQIAELRQAITATEDIPGLVDLADVSELASVGELAATAHEAWRAYVDGRHVELMHALPMLLGDSRRLAHATNGDQHAGAQRLLSMAYRLAAGTAGRYGYTDLAWSSARSALEHARHSDSADLETAISTRYLVWALVRQRRFDDAERVAVAAAEQIQPVMLDRDAQRAGVFGNLLFNAASAATAQASHGRAEDLLAEARAAATRSSADYVSEAAIFGPRVAALQTVEGAARSGDAEEALRLAATVPASRGGVPAFWEAGHRLTMAAASQQTRHYDHAIAYLAQARDLAPDWVRHQPLGSSTMHRLIDRAPRRPGAEFAALAAHYGVIEDRVPRS